MEKTNEILTIAGERVEVRHNMNISKTCVRCCFKRGVRECGALSDCKPVPCLNFQNLEEGYAYFVPAEKDDKEFCKDNCKGYQETGRCFADGDCKAKQETESKANITLEADFEAEIKRFFDECIVVHHIKMYGSDETVIYANSYELIARHFAEWERKRTLDKVVEWMKKNLTYIHPRKGVETCMVNIPAFLDAMNE